MSCTLMSHSNALAYRSRPVLNDVERFWNGSSIHECYSLNASRMCKVDTSFVKILRVVNALENRTLDTSPSERSSSCLKELLTVRLRPVEDCLTIESSFKYIFFLSENFFLFHRPASHKCLTIEMSVTLSR